MSESPYRAKRPPDEEFTGRLRHVQEGMRDRALDGIVGFSAYMEREGNVLYLTGHRNVFPPWASDSVRNGAGLAAVLVPQDGLVTLFSSYRGDQKSLAGTIEDVVQTLDLSGSIVEAIRRRYGSDGAKVLGIAGSDVMTVLLYRRLVDAFPERVWRDLGATKDERIAAAEQLDAIGRRTRAHLSLRDQADTSLAGPGRNAIERALGVKPGRDFAVRGDDVREDVAS